MKAGLSLTKDEKKAIPFVLPGLLVASVLIIYPLFYIIRLSFLDSSTAVSSFSGFSNFMRLFRNPQFSDALSTTAVWTFLTVTISYLLGLAFALLIHGKRVQLKGFWRSILFVAWIMPGVVKATAWKWLFATESGMVNHILQSFGIISQPIPFLSNPQYAIYSIIVVQIWACAPYVMLMMSAGLQMLSKELYESADLDGANLFQRTYYITLPLLRDISFICVLMLFIWAINEFALIWIMTTGGHGTTTLSLLVYNQFRVLNLNAASASAIMQLAVTMLFALIYIRLLSKEVRT